MAAENRLRKVQIAKAEGKFINSNKNNRITLGKLRNWYLNLAEVNLASSIYNTYDRLLGKKYEIDINHQALERVKNLVK